MKNEAKLKEMGLEKEVRYYYMKFGQNSHGKAVLGVATVCLIPYGSRITGAGDSQCYSYVRGIAFCNPLDQFNRKLGRNIALGRAIKAIETGSAREPIPGRTPAWILKNNRGMDFFSEFNPELTDYEQSLMRSRIALKDTMLPERICANLRRSGLNYLDQLKGDEDKWVRNIGKRAVAWIRAEIERQGRKV